MIAPRGFADFWKGALLRIFPSRCGPPIFISATDIERQAGTCLACLENESRVSEALAEPVPP